MVAEKSSSPGGRFCSESHSSFDTGGVRNLCVVYVCVKCIMEGYDRKQLDSRYFIRFFIKIYKKYSFYNIF